MSEICLMTTIINRSMMPKILAFYQRQKVTVNFATLGRGTAASEVLDYFGLEGSEKAVLLAMVTDLVWKDIKKGLQMNRLYHSDGKHRRPAGAFVFNRESGL